MGRNGSEVTVRFKEAFKVSHELAKKKVEKVFTHCKTIDIII